MSQIREFSANPNGFSSYPLTGDLRPIGSYPLTRNLNPYGSQIREFSSYPLTRNLDPVGFYPLTRNLDPLGAGFNWGGLLGGLVSDVTGVSIPSGSSGGAGGGTVVNVLPSAQPAPPVPFNWTPVIVSAGVVLVALTLIMTTTRK